MHESNIKYACQVISYEIYLLYCSSNKKKYNVKIWKKLIYWNEEKTDNIKIKTKRWKHIRNYTIIIYDENAMEIANRHTIQCKEN
jgi:hypothetical protein